MLLIPKNLAECGLRFQQSRLDLCASSSQLLLPQLLFDVRQLFLNRVDLGQRAARFDGFAKDLLAQLKLLL